MVGGSGTGARRVRWSPVLLVALIAVVGAMVVVPGVGGGSRADPLSSPELGGLQLLTEAQAMQRARESGEPTVADALTTSNMVITAMPEGRFRAEISLTDERVRDEAGAWQPVDNTLVFREDGSVGPVRGAVPISFSGGGSGPLAQIANEDRSLALSWPTGGLPKPTLTGTAANYESVLPGVDLVAQAGPEGFTTFVVVHSADAASHPAVRDLTFKVKTQGVELDDNTRTGGLTATDGAETVFTAPAFLAWDSEGASAAVEPSFTKEENAADAPLNAPLQAEPVRMTPEVSPGEISLDTSGVLGRPDTIYPAVLDPSVTMGRVNWTMLWSNGTTMYNSATEHARVGYDGWSGSPKISRSYFKMDIPLSTLTDTMIDSATFAHRLIHTPTHNCDLPTYGPAVEVYRTEAFTSSTTWATKPAGLGFQSQNSTSYGHEDCGTPGRQEWNVLSGLKAAVSEAKSTVNFMLKSKEESNREGWRKYDQTSNLPELYIEYYQYPPAPGGVTLPAKSSAAGLWTADATPELSATGVSDPNGGSAHALFQILGAGGVEVWRGVSAAGAATGHTAKITVPAGKLVNGAAYTVRAWAAADSLGKFLSKTYKQLSFGIDTSVPAAPTIRQDGDCTVGTNCAFTLTGPADATEYVYGLNTDAPALVTTLSPVGAAKAVTMPANIFGPSWVTAKSEDRAGNRSVSRVLNFRILSTSMSHKWSLDSNGNDTGLPGGSTLTFPAGQSWLPGPHDGNVDGTGLDATDDALEGGSGRYAAAGAAPTGLPAFSTGDDFSVATWVRMPSSSSAATVLSQAGSTGNAFTLGYGDGQWSFAVKGADDTAAPVTVSAPARAGPGDWVHLAAVYNNETSLDLAPGETPRPRRITLFVDGRPAATLAQNVPTVFAASGRFLIGCQSTSGALGSYWSGLIDDVRTFPGVIDETQVLRIASERRPTS